MLISPFYLHFESSITALILCVLPIVIPQLVNNKLNHPIVIPQLVNNKLNHPIVSPQLVNNKLDLPIVIPQLVNNKLDLPIAILQLEIIALCKLNGCKALSNSYIPLHPNL